MDLPGDCAFAYADLPHQQHRNVAVGEFVDNHFNGSHIRADGFHKPFVPSWRRLHEFRSPSFWSPSFRSPGLRGAIILRHENLSHENFAKFQGEVCGKRLTPSLQEGCHLGAAWKRLLWNSASNVFWRLAQM
jgi:hypothetical protein